MGDLPPPTWPAADESPDDEGPSFSESLSAPEPGGPGSSARAIGLGVGVLLLFTVVALLGGLAIFATPFSSSVEQEAVEVDVAERRASGSAVSDGEFGEVDGPADVGAVLRSGEGVVGEFVADGLPVAHPLTVATRGAVDLEVVEADFDTVLAVVAADGRVIEVDDDSGAQLRSRVTTELEPGTYEVRVFGYSVNDGGSYELRLD